MQLYADIYLLLNYSTCFGRLTAFALVSACQADRQRLERMQLNAVARTIQLPVWSVPEAATTLLCTPDDECDGRPKHVE